MVNLQTMMACHSRCRERQIEIIVLTGPSYLYNISLFISLSLLREIANDFVIYGELSVKIQKDLVIDTAHQQHATRNTQPRTTFIGFAGGDDLSGIAGLCRRTVEALRESTGLDKDDEEQNEVPSTSSK
jgi:hypothetical protein